MTLLAPKPQAAAVVTRPDLPDLLLAAYRRVERIEAKLDLADRLVGRCGR